MAFINFSRFKSPLPWIVGIMAGGIIIVGGTIYSIVQSPNPQLEIDNLTVPVQRKNLRVEIKASGKVEPVQSVNISPKNPGILAKLLVEQGDMVKQGQVLAVMENAELNAQGFEAQARVKEAIANLQQTQIRIPEDIKQIQARLVQAQASLEQVKQRMPKDIEQGQSQLRAAQSRLALAQERVKRNKYLLQEGAIAQDAYDEAVNEYRNAQATALEILQRLEQTRNTQPPEILQLEGSIAEIKLDLQEKQKVASQEIAALTAAVEAAQGQLQLIKVQYQDTIIRAPFNGVVTQKYATEGSFVTPTTSASSTASATSSSILALARGLEIVAKVPEVDISQLKPGQPVNIIADAYPDQIFQGGVKRIAPEAVVEQNVTSFEVTVGLIDGLDKLRSKMNVDVTFLGQEINDALVIPTVAIVTEDGKTGVMTPNLENKPEFKPVTIGLTIDNQTQILKGLNSGERVFIDLPEDKTKKDEDK